MTRHSFVKNPCWTDKKVCVSLMKYVKKEGEMNVYLLSFGRTLWRSS